MRSKLATLMVLLCACGPEVDEVPVQYEPRVCGQEGPVQVLAVDEPGGSAIVRVVDGRWMILRFSFVDAEDGQSVQFAADTVEPCGGDRVGLPENLWPFVVGETLMGCDVFEGTIYHLDAHTGMRGARVAEGLQCDPLTSGGGIVLMRDLEHGTLSVLSEAGEVHTTPIPFAIQEGESDVLEPFLVDPFSVLVGRSPLPSRIRWAGDAGVLVLGDEGQLWQFEQGTIIPRALAASVDAFLASEDVAVFRRVEHADAEEYPVQLVDLRTGTVREGPSVGRLSMHGPYLEIDGGLFDPAEDTVWPNPLGGRVSGVWPEPEPLAYRSLDGLRVWSVETGEIVLDSHQHGLGGGSPQLWDDAVTVVHHGVCGGDEVRIYPLDGSDPRVSYKAPDGSGVWVLSAHELMVYSACSAGGLTYENLRTGESWQVIDDIAGTVQITTAVAASPVFEGREPLFFQVQGDEPGIWVTLLPRG